MKELYEKYVGKKAAISIGGLTVYVRIFDVKERYGKARFLVRPLAGEREVWVEKVDVMCEECGEIGLHRAICSLLPLD